MKAITIHQPYAELIAAGVKRVENRSWKTNFRGTVAIHAGRADSHELRDAATAHALEFDELTRGAIIAVGEIVDCVTLIDAKQRRLAGDGLAWLADHAHANGPYCWILANVRRLETPIAATGKQG